MKHTKKLAAALVLTLALGTTAFAAGPHHAARTYYTDANGDGICDACGTRHGGSYHAGRHGSCR